MGYQTKHPRTIVVVASTEKYLGCVFGLLIAFGLGIFAGQQECHTFYHGQHPDVLFSWRRWVLMAFEIIDIICMLVAGKIGRSAVAFKHGLCQQRLLRNFFLLNVIGLLISLSDMIATICILLKIDPDDSTGNIWIIGEKSELYLPATVIFFVFIVMKIGVQGVAAYLSHDCVCRQNSSGPSTLLDFDSAENGIRKISSGSRRISSAYRKGSLLEGKTVFPVNDRKLSNCSNERTVPQSGESSKKTSNQTLTVQSNELKI